MAVNFGLQLVILTVAVCHFCASYAGAEELELRVIDAQTKEPIAARIHLKDAQGKPVKQPKTVAWHDHFLIPGKMTLSLKPGVYTFEMECGPEFKQRSGNFVIEKGAADSKEVEMVRFVDLAKEGWYSGDLHVHRPLEDMPLIMTAEDLRVAPVITWWNEKNTWQGKDLPKEPVASVAGERFYHALAGEDERGGGALLYFNLARPLDIAAAEREFPSSVAFLTAAKDASSRVHVDAEKPFWWDFPVWLATGKVDTIGICHNHLQRDGMLANEAWGKPRDKKRYPAVVDNGRYSLDIYFHVLNSGLRIPPSAGSASGVLPNPVGYNRVYVHCGEKFSYDEWFAGLKAGRVFVTNGPLLRPLVNGKLPGHVFSVEEGEAVELNIALNLSLRDKVEYLEIIKDGAVVDEVRLDQFKKAGGMLPPVTFKESGWLAVRAVTNNPKTYRFAMTGPYYVEIGYRPRISKTSAQFFLDWVTERAKQLKLEDPAQREAVLVHLRAARDFWQARVERANAP